MMHFWVISVVLSIVLLELISVGFKTDFYVYLMIFIVKILHSHIVVHVSPLVIELSNFML